MTAMPRAPSAEDAEAEMLAPELAPAAAAVRRAWTPWVVLSVFVFLWGTPQVRAGLDGVWAAKVPVTGLNEMVQKVPPVVAEPHLEAAVYNFNALSATGTGILRLTFARMTTSTCTPQAGDYQVFALRT